MDKESIFLLKKIDCNCNDCKYLVRDFKKYEESLALHYRWQFDYFNIIKENLVKRAKEWEQKGEQEKAGNLYKEAKALVFQFERSAASIFYGKCLKLNKSISFIPNICQLETQGCFVHRKDSL